MEPFLLKPATKEYLWGGKQLAWRYSKRSSGPVIAESWELSAHAGGSSVIATGPFRGLPFSSFCRQHPQAVMQAFGADERFPVMIKLIDAAKPLSVQVHPGDSYAWKHENEPGKTEAWFILDSQPGAYLYYGFKKNTTRREVARHIAQNSLEELLNKLTVRKGDVVYVPAGTIHAIGAGLLVAEVQQTSDSTYRVYDYGRLGADGQPRMLHVEKSLDVLDYGKARMPVPGRLPPVEKAQWSMQQMLACPYFTARSLRLNGRYTSTAAGSAFVCVVCLEGSAIVKPPEAGLLLSAGHTAFIPAGLPWFQLSGAGTFLFVSAPAAAARHAAANLLREA